MQKPSIGLTDAQRAGVIEILNTLLADEYVLYTKTRNFHWNVTGPQFNDLHKFFEAQYAELNVIVDDVAERARPLGGEAAGSLAEFLRPLATRPDLRDALGAANLTVHYRPFDWRLNAVAAERPSE